MLAPLARRLAALAVMILVAMPPIDRSLAAEQNPTATYLSGSTDQDGPLRHIPDYDVLALAFPPSLWRLNTSSRADYLAKLAQDPAPVRRVRLLLGLGETIHQGNPDGLYVYFSSPSGTLAPELLPALREAGLTERAETVAEGIAAFGPNYPTDDKLRADFFAYSFLRVQEGVVPDPSKTPTAVDRTLKDLGRRFMDETKFREEVEAYANRDAALKSALEKARMELSDDDRLSYLQQQLIEEGISGFGDGTLIKDLMDRMAVAYRDIFVLTLFSGELANGGMHQFFFNSSGAFAQYAAQALRRLGKTDAAEAVEKGIAMFPAPYSRSTEERRRVSFSHEWNDWDDRLSGLGDAIDGDDILKAMVGYARRENILPR